MARNATLERLESGEAALGAFVSSTSHRAAELLAGEVDWIGLDMEHAPVTAADVEAVARGIEGDATPIVRLPSVDAAASGWAKRTLDAGAQGLIVPRIESAEDARLAVEAAYYPPAGDRGLAGSTRVTGYGANLEEYVADAEESTFLCVQIETRAGVGNAAEALAVDGVDAVLIGETDLSSTHGHHGEIDHPEVKDAVERIRGAAEENGVHPGIVARAPDRVADRLDRGFRFMLLGSDLGFTRRGLADYLP